MHCRLRVIYKAVFRALPEHASLRSVTAEVDRLLERLRLGSDSRPTDCFSQSSSRVLITENNTPSIASNGLLQALRSKISMCNIVKEKLAI